MKHKKLFALVLLAAATLFVTSCEDDDNWKPIWAVPLISEMKMQVSDFVDSAQVAEFNAQIRQIWHDYVAEELGIGGGQETVDSVAFLILTSINSDSLHTYVDITEDGPQLNDTTKNMLAEMGVTEDMIDIINSFLNDYWANNPDIWSAWGKAFVKKTSHVAAPKNTGGSEANGTTAIDFLLQGIIGDSKDIFVTAANIMDRLSNTPYFNEIDTQLDEVLQKANMNDTIELDLSSMAQGVEISYVKLEMNISNTMPFSVNFAASFVDSVGNELLKIFNNDTLSVNQLNKQLIFEGRDLAEKFEKTKGISLKVDCTKNAPLTSDMLRTLAEKGITISNMRVKAQAGMGSLLNQ